MIEQEKDGIPTFQFESLMRYGRIRHAVFTRKGGEGAAPFDTLNLSVSVPEPKKTVYANRARAYGALGRSTETLVHAHLVHGSDVARVTRADDGGWVEFVDGLVTNQPTCGLTMNYADCAPIFLYDPANHAIGLGHAGWKGAVNDLPGAMVRKMQLEFGSDPVQLVAAIGPCIGVAQYEVDEPVISAVHQAFPHPETLLVPSTNGPLFDASNGRPHFDLAEANRQNLHRAGVQQIELSGLCTASRTDLFFSHRAEQGKTGRFGALFILE